MGAAQARGKQVGNTFHVSLFPFISLFYFTFFCPCGRGRPAAISWPCLVRSDLTSGGTERGKGASSPIAALLPGNDSTQF